MKKHINIPVFIPHLGCPNQCVFCNQRTISGTTVFNKECVIDIIENGLSTVDKATEVEIAFFGGSFTGIERDLMIELLEIANVYIKNGRVKSIRCSTRPDYITPEILDILKKYNVETIELGLQSSSDCVLTITQRGHSFTDERRACALILEYGFKLIGQMMIGLPGSDLKSEIETARFIIESGCHGARIYPTVVFKDTELYNMLLDGRYTALSLDEAVSRSALILDLFRKKGVEVIRIGLCSQDNLFDERTYAAGPNHPALGELVENEIFYNNFKNALKNKAENKNSVLKVYVNDRMLSKAIGQKKRNILRLIKEFKFSDVKIYPNKQLAGYEFTCEYERKR